MPPRRHPSQARSRATVARILAAAATVLAQRGWAGASTNAIAAEAGVSPGTLYQYFADKDAIVGALVGQVVADFEARITPALRETLSEPPEAPARPLIDAVLDALEADAPLLRAVVDHLPPAEQARRLAAVNTRLADAVHVLQGRRRPELGEAELDAIAWLVVTTAQQLVVRYVLDAPPLPRPVFAAALERVLDAIPPP